MTIGNAMLVARVNKIHTEPNALYKPGLYVILKAFRNVGCGFAIRVSWDNLKKTDLISMWGFDAAYD